MAYRGDLSPLKLIEPHAKDIVRFQSVVAHMTP